MNNKGFIFLGTICGAIIGAAVSYFITTNRCRQDIANELEEEYAEAKAAFERKYEERMGEPVNKKYSGRFPWGSGDDSSQHDDIEEYKSLVSDYEAAVEDSNDISDNVAANIVAITLEEFGTRDDYEQRILYCYDDGIIVDEREYVVDNNDQIGDIDPRDYFDDENESMYIRNDGLKIDFEIIHIEREYNDD